MISLTWGQVNTWRLMQQGLVTRAGPQELIAAIRRVGGIHAQVMSAAELAIAARLDGITPEAVQDALWFEHILIKTWALRLTLHIIPVDDFPLYIGARLNTDLNWPEHFRRQGITNDVLEAYLAVGPQILDGQPITRQQFVAVVDERIHSPELHDYLAKSGWGMSLKPLACHGELCVGPTQGQNATYVRPSTWIGAWQPAAPEEALKEVVRRYLHTYGPAKFYDFRRWWWAGSAPAKKAFDGLADEIEDVEVEGWRGMALRAEIPAIQALEVKEVVRLLPLFDTYTIGATATMRLPGFLSPVELKKVYRPQGWVSAAVVVDGFIKGIWEYKTHRSTTTIKVDLFTSIPKTVKEGIAGEGERLGKFLNTAIQLEFIQS